MVILALLGLIVLSKAEIILTGWHDFVQAAIWFVVAFSVISSILNIITKSVRERSLWAPVTVLMLISSLIVAIG